MGSHTDDMGHTNDMGGMNDMGHASGMGGMGGRGMGGKGDLQDLLQDLLQADKFFFAELDPLNNAGFEGKAVEGAALLALKGDQLTVITVATGVEPGQLHPQHIHGFEDGREGNIPDISFDDDRDGIVETEEGSDAYGPILLDLTSPPGSGLSGFPTPTGDSFVFVQTYDLSDPSSGPMGGLVLRTEAGADVPLTNRVIVLHGETLLEGQGEGTGFSADGTPGYKPLIPIASGEIEALNPGQGLNAFSSFVLGQNDLFG